MTQPDRPAAPGADTLANRRWLIGIGITGLFGLFGVVMALLAYQDRRPAPAAAEPPGVSAPRGASPQPAPADTPARPSRGPDEDRGQKRDPD